MATDAGKQRGRTWPYLLLVLLLGFAGYTALARWWSYSDGERVGILQKLSHKGWVCKTYEGELAQYVVMGVTPQIWSFTVSDPGGVPQAQRPAGRAGPAALRRARRAADQLLWRHALFCGSRGGS